MDAVDVRAERSAELHGYVADFLVGLRERIAVVAECGDHRDVADAMGAVEQAIRGAEAESIALVDAAERRALYLDDGHRGVKDFVVASLRVPSGVALARTRCAKLTRNHPLIGELLGAGTLGVAQARELARLHAHPRCGGQFDAAAGDLLDSALRDDYDTFQSRTREWERLADEDGAHRGAEQAHHDRRAQLTLVGDEFHLIARFGVLQGEALKLVFDAFADAEYTTDRDEAIVQHGESWNHGDLARTAAQRRADAVVAIFLAAAGAPPCGTAIEVCVDVVIDQASFERQLAELAADLHDNGSRWSTPREWVADNLPDVDVRRLCHTLSGAPIDPAEAVAMALIGRVRRVVLGASSNVIDLGRRHRLYVGSARDAVLIQEALDGGIRCRWPGCGRPRVQIDHTTEWSDHGCTDTCNGGPFCGFHNRLKSTGYTARRDDHGRWHLYRPDGSELRAA